MHRPWRTILIGLVWATAGLAASAVLVSTILPLIVVPDEVQSGTDLVGNAFSPHGGVQVTVRVGSHVLWRSGVGDNDTDFCVPIPDGATGVVTVEAEDSQGNHNIANVPIVP